MLTRGLHCMRSKVPKPYSARYKYAHLDAFDRQPTDHRHLALILAIGRQRMPRR
jgi:hypothetical protein